MLPHRLPGLPPRLTATYPRPPPRHPPTRPAWQDSTTSKTTTAERRSGAPRRRLQEVKRRDRRRRPHRPRPELGFSPGEHETLNAGELGAPQRCLQEGERHPGASSSPAPTESGRAFTRSTILPRCPSPAGQTKHAGQQASADAHHPAVMPLNPKATSTQPPLARSGRKDQTAASPPTRSAPTTGRTPPRTGDAAPTIHGGQQAAAADPPLSQPAPSREGNDQSRCFPCTAATPHHHTTPSPRCASPCSHHRSPGPPPWLTAPLRA